MTTSATTTATISATRNEAQARLPKARRKAAHKGIRPAARKYQVPWEDTAAMSQGGNYPVATSPSFCTFHAFDPGLPPPSVLAAYGSL